MSFFDTTECSSVKRAQPIIRYMALIVIIFSSTNFIETQNKLEEESLTTEIILIIFLLYYSSFEEF
jgi:hypothetical protein